MISKLYLLIEGKITVKYNSYDDNNCFIFLMIVVIEENTYKSITILSSFEENVFCFSHAQFGQERFSLKQD